MPELRGHHLICLHFFNGEGYSKEFINNLETVISKSKETSVLTISTADDVCKKCPWIDEYLICMNEKAAEEEIKKMDEFALNILNISPGDELTWVDLQEKVGKVFNQWHEQCCNKCSFKQICEKNSLFQCFQGNPKRE